MKKIKFTITNLFILILFSGCSKYYLKTIQQLDKQDFEQSELTPEVDFFDLRIDILRQMSSTTGYDGSVTMQEVPYHSITFNLGNGIIFDLNNNFAFSVLDLLEIEKGENFTIVKEDFKTGKILCKYIFENNTFSVQTNGFLVNFESNENIYISDSLVVAEGGLLSKFTVKISADEIEYKTLLANDKIFKQSKGWYNKNLFGQTDYLYIDNNLYFGNSYVLKNSGNQIDLINGTNPNSTFYLYSVVKTDNEIYCYNNNYNGFKIYFDFNKIVIENNGKKLYSYYKEI